MDIFPVNFKKLSKKEQTIRLLSVLKKHPEGLTSKEWCTYAGCTWRTLLYRINSEKIRKHLWIRYIGANNTCLFYNLNHSRRLRRIAKDAQEATFNKSSPVRHGGKHAN